MIPFIFSVSVCNTFKSLAKVMQAIKEININKSNSLYPNITYLLILVFLSAALVKV
jgi:hypothetical protein